jgi:hypothetical protein
MAPIQAGVHILISNWVYFIDKIVWLKELTHQEEIIINLYGPNVGALNFIKINHWTENSDRPQTAIVILHYHQHVDHPDKKNQQRNFRIEGHHWLNGLDRHLHSIPSCNSKIYILLSSQFNVLLNKLYFIS